jgi:hypothetical protein
MKAGDLMLGMVSTLAALFAVEALLNQFANLRSRPAFDFGIVAHDNRDWLHALYDLRAAGVEAYPIMSAEVYSQTFLDRGNERALLPLAGISNITTTFCNELGRFIVYKSDRHGFRNPDRAWDATAPTLLVGDSFAQGACVPEGSTIAAEFMCRNRAVVSVAYNANGPLVELATLVEYGPALRPPLVIWLYHEGNDLTDLGRELDVPILRKYIEPGFSQNLIARQIEIDRTIRAALDARPEIQGVTAAARQHWSLSGVLGLRNVRAQLRGAWDAVSAQRSAPPAKPELDDAVATPASEQRLSDFEIVLTRARDIAAQWGGRIHLAYLPASERFRFPQLQEIATLDRTKAEILNITASLDIPVIDLDAPIRATPDPARLYPKANWPVHLDVEGYRLIAKAIADRLPAAP